MQNADVERDVYVFRFKPEGSNHLCPLWMTGGLTYIAQPSTIFRSLIIMGKEE
jgi:hypothetical protein